MDEEVKVLVIDDDDVDRLTLTRALKKSEITHRVTECARAEDAFQLLRENRYDCIFLDYLLPGTDGLMLLRKFRLDGIKTPVIVVTSQGNEKIAVEMMKAGASDYIVKDHINPTNMKRIIQTVIFRREMERHQEMAEAALKTSEARLAEAQKIAKMGSWEFTPDFQEVYWSEEMYRIFEVDASFDPKTRHHLSYFHPDDVKVVKEGLVNTLRGIRFNRDLQIVKPDGSYKYVNVQAYYHVDAKNNEGKYIGTVQDVDARKKVEHELVEAKKLAEESGKIKEQFLANMSHEIRTPLNAIIGFSNLLLGNQNNFTEEDLSSIRAIHRASDHLLGIINDILDVSKIQSGKLAFEEMEFSPRDLVAGVLDLFKLKAKQKGIELLYKVDECVPAYLIGDSVRLNQILVNLTGNAVKFTDKGFVKVFVDVVSSSSEAVSLRFTVEDSGIGIASNKFTSIFESFTQASNDTTRVYGGTGLGLTIVKKLVELQKGEISVSSQLNEGAVFNVVLPFKKGDKDATKRDTNTYIQPDEYPKNLKVLMAEDNELNQLLSKSMFARLGWELDIAENGKVAWEKVQRTEYDVILMDVQMPEMDGYQTTQKIRHELPKPLSEIPIIAITAHSLPSELKKCLDAGMNGYVSKPFKINELTAKITALMNEGKSSMKTI